jgi:hypothetical protein
MLFSLQTMSARQFSRSGARFNSTGLRSTTSSDPEGTPPPDRIQSGRILFPKSSRVDSFATSTKSVPEAACLEPGVRLNLGRFFPKPGHAQNRSGGGLVYGLARLDPAIFGLGSIRLRSDQYNALGLPSDNRGHFVDMTHEHVSVEDKVIGRKYSDDCVGICGTYPVRQE